MCENWGYKRLWKKLREESIGEMRHADRLIERILYLEGVPNVQRLGKVNVGQTVPEQLRLDLELERGAVAALNAGVELCRGRATTAAATCWRTSSTRKRGTSTGSRSRWS